MIDMTTMVGALDERDGGEIAGDVLARHGFDATGLEAFRILARPATDAERAAAAEHQRLLDEHTAARRAEAARLKRMHTAELRARLDAELAGAGIPSQARFDVWDRHPKDTADARQIAWEWLKQWQVERLDHEGMAAKAWDFRVRGMVPVLLLGGSWGTGKTHLGMSCIRWAVWHGASWMYGTLSEFLATTGQGDHAFATMRRWLSADIVLLDEAPTSDRKLTEAMSGRLYDLLNRRWQMGRATVVTSNRQTWPDILDGVDPDTRGKLLDRLEPEGATLTVPMVWESHRRRGQTAREGV